MIGILMVIGLIVVVGVIIGYPTMLLWNWLMPEIFGLTKITFLQAVGLYILSGIMIKSGKLSSK